MGEPIHPLLAEHVRQDRRVTWVLALTAVLVVLVALGTPAVISTSNTTAQVVEGNDVAACRSQASAGVTEARTRFDVARATRDTAATHKDDLLTQGLVAAVTDDEAGLQRVFEQLPAARQEVLDAEAVVVDATADLQATEDRFHRMVVLSREDPERFLAQCREVE